MKKENDFLWLGQGFGDFPKSILLGSSKLKKTFMWV